MGNPHIERLETRRLLASGDLDPTFGVAGRRADDLGDLHNIAGAVELPGGKILVAGGTIDILLADQRHYMLRRYNADGTLDSTFGQGGEVLGNFFPIVGDPNDDGHDPQQDDDSNITEIVLQDDGKIVARGAGKANAFFEVVARFNSDGSLDTTFGGGDGVADSPVAGDHKWTVQPDGKILLSDLDKIIRLNADGSTDTTFGNQGTVNLPINVVRLIDVQAGGKILIAGGSANPDALQMTRLNADGSVDTPFGTNGVVNGPTLSNSARNALQEMLVLPSGKILAAGNAASGFHIARFNADGTLDTTYGDGGDGETVIPFGGFATLGRLVLDPDGNAILLGKSSAFEAARVSPDGIYDETFGRLFGSNRDDGFYYTPSAFMQGSDKLLLVGAHNAQVGPSDFRTFVTFDRVKSNDSSPASPIGLNAGMLALAGTSGDDAIQLMNDGAQAFTTLNGFGRVFDATDVQQWDIDAAAGNDILIASGLTANAEIDLGAGNDWINAQSVVANTHIVGGPGSDKIAGGSGRDTLEGNGGRDYIDGGAGADVISGGAGNDQIRGQASSDHLYGRAGNDYLEGNGGNDALDGGNGIDTLHGSGGNDLLVSTGDNAIDSLFGDDGQDRSHADGDDVSDSIESLV